jgi:predicted RNA-binding Zn ribbon-like protein
MVTAQEAAGRTSPEGQAAPGALEQVRELLNSWLIPNDTRQPADRFEELASRRQWARQDAKVIRELRDDLRHVVEDGGVAAADNLTGWIGRLGMRPVIAGGQIDYRHDGGPAAGIFAIVMAAISAGTWVRLKACPDCRWVFYDNTRNGSKRWCLMTAGGPDGRACGTISKVRRYRDRQAAAQAR